MTSRMTMISGNSQKRPLNFYFFAFCSVIYQKYITQTGLSCSKQLETTFHQFCEKPMHITSLVELLTSVSCSAMIPTVAWHEGHLAHIPIAISDFVSFDPTALYKCFYYYCYSAPSQYYVDAAYRQSSMVCLSVCLSQSWAVQGRLNWSRCCFGCGITWVQGTVY